MLLAITQLYLQDIQNNNSCKTIFKNLFVQDNPSKFLIEIFNKLNLNLIETDQFINYLKIKNLKCENVWIHGFAPMKYSLHKFLISNSVNNKFIYADGFNNITIPISKDRKSKKYLDYKKIYKISKILYFGWDSEKLFSKDVITILKSIRKVTLFNF